MWLRIRWRFASDGLRHIARVSASGSSWICALNFAASDSSFAVALVQQLCVALHSVIRRYVIINALDIGCPKVQIINGYDALNCVDCITRRASLRAMRQRGSSGPRCDGCQGRMPKWPNSPNPKRFVIVIKLPDTNNNEEAHRSARLPVAHRLQIEVCTKAAFSCPMGRLPLLGKMRRVPKT